MRRKLLAAAAALALLTLLTTARRARAVDPFEIQVYDGTANAQGQGGLELHLNDVASGVKTGEGTELPQHGVTHATLEPSYGLFPWWELGAYFQMARRDDGTIDYGGVKLRSKFVEPPGWSEHLRLGVNFEVSALPDTYDKDVWAAEIRPIFGWANDDWSFIVNPIVGVPFGGPDWRYGPSFEPAATALRDILRTVDVGVEYYGSFGAFSNPATGGDQVHYLFEVVDLVCVRNLELNVGIGEGVTSSSNPLVLKMIVGYTFDVVPSKS
jgi:hypothetical protein